MTRVAVAALLAIGCGKTAEDPAAQQRVAPVNALVPPALANQLVFEQRKVVDGPYRYLVAVPRGWEQLVTIFGPSDETANMVRYLYKCAGEPCAPADWNREIDKVYEEAGIQRDQVEKDEKRPTSRTIIAEHEGMTALVVGTWVAGADHYMWCEAHLDPPWSDAIAAFEKACHSVTVTDSGGFVLQ
jgi:hypothetical protein